MVTGASTADARRHPDRRAEGRADADPAAQLSRLAARHSPRRAGDQQDGSRRTTRARCSTRIERDYREFAARIGLAGRRRAFRCRRCTATTSSGAQRATCPGTTGPTLIEHLENVPVGDDVASKPFRLPVQWVNRPNPDFRGFAGRDRRAAPLRVGDQVRVLPSGRQTSRSPGSSSAIARLDSARRRPVGHGDAGRRNRREPRRRARRRRTRRRPSPISSRPPSSGCTSGRCCRADRT